MGHRIRGASVYLRENNDFFNLAMAAWIIQTDKSTSQKGHADTHDLPGAEMTMGFRR
jgi:hypothetical protein